MKYKFLTIVFTILLCLSFFMGCSAKVNYNAILYDNAVDWISDDFETSNVVGSSQSTFPSERTFIIKNQEEYNQIFVSDIEELEIDFTFQMLLVYTFRDIYRKNYYLESVIAENGILKIVCQMEKLKAGTGSATNPYQRWFVIKLDKIDITAFELENNR